MAAENSSGALSTGPGSDTECGWSNTRRPASVMDWWRSQHLSRTVARYKSVDAGSVPGSDSARRHETELVSAGAPSSSEATEGRTGDHGSPWTTSQLRSLHEAQTNTVPSKDDFWSAVAGKVAGRDAQQCQQKWFENFATPSGPNIRTTGTRAGRRKAGERKGDASKQWEAKPLTEIRSFSQQSRDFRSPSSTNGVRSVTDDLFHATPLRGQSRFAGQSRGDEVAEVEQGTPKTPCGPRAQQHGKAPTWAMGSGDMNASTDTKPSQRRAVSKAYVQAISKKMRKTFGTSKGGSARDETTTLGVGRRIHAVGNLEGHTLKVSISESGVVMLASLDGDGENSILGDSDESNDE